MERNVWIDIAKGIAIILMVLGHSGIPLEISNFIYAFHMPLFLVASGWMTNWEKYLFSSFFIRRVKSLLIPFIIYSLIVLSIKQLTGMGDVNHWLINGWGGYALWFIPVLFVASIVAKSLSMIKRVPMLVFGVIFMLLGALAKYYGLSIPWTMNSVPYATGLILIGSCLSRYEEYIIRARWWILCFGFLVTIVISCFWRFDLASNGVLPFFPLAIGALSGTLMMFSVSSCISNYSKWLSGIFSAIGRETYIVLAFSQIIIVELLEYTNFNGIIRYLILIITLLVLKYLKDSIVNLFNKLVW